MTSLKNSHRESNQSNLRRASNEENYQNLINIKVKTSSNNLSTVMIKSKPHLDDDNGEVLEQTSHVDVKKKHMFLLIS